MARLIKILLPIAILFAVSDFYSQSIKPIARQSDLDGKNLRYGLGTGRLVRAEMDSRIREFLWNNWAAKRKAKVTATVYSIEGEPTKTVFQIRNDRDRGLSLTIKIVKTSGWFFWNRTKEVTVSNYYDLERVEPMTDALSQQIPKPISADVVRQADDYRLRFKAFNRTDDFLF